MHTYHAWSTLPGGKSGRHWLALPHNNVIKAACSSKYSEGVVSVGTQTGQGDGVGGAVLTEQIIITQVLHLLTKEKCKCQYSTIQTIKQ